MSLSFIQNCYDSHVHWSATGEYSSRLDLSQLKAAPSISELRPESHHFRGDWLTGFGWDQNLWPTQDFPTRQTLDQHFPDLPVAFTRVDGHALWVNTKALVHAGFLDQKGQLTLFGRQDIDGGKILRDQSGIPTGIFIDIAMEAIYRMIPEISAQMMETQLLKGQKVFHSAGVTHIRDLSCSELQWNEQVRLEQRGLLQLAVEQFFNANQPADFHRALNLALRAKRENVRLSKSVGIKVYFDGALGSEGALLSQCYCDRSHRGLQLISPEDLELMMKETWDNHLEIAVHAIGDLAARRVLLSALRVWNTNSGKGKLNIEHAQLLDPETIQMMKGRSVVCHFQPCHWLSDRRWMEKKIGDLQRYAFRWRSLEEAGIPFHFGSDSPIEPSSPSLNLHAVGEAALLNIPQLLKPFSHYQSHPTGETWTPNTFSRFEDGRVSQLVFLGQRLQ